MPQPSNEDLFNEYMKTLNSATGTPTPEPVTQPELQTTPVTPLPTESEPLLPDYTKPRAASGVEFVPEYTLSQKGMEYLSEGLEDRNLLHESAGGVLGRALTTGGEVVGKAYTAAKTGRWPGKEYETATGSDDFYNLKTGRVNLAGLQKSNIPAENRYEILADIAEQFHVNRDIFEKLLPSSVYYRRSDGKWESAAKFAGRVAQQTTIIPEMTIRYGIRKAQDFPKPSSFPGSDAEWEETLKYVQSWGDSLNTTGTAQAAEIAQMAAVWATAGLAGPLVAQNLISKAVSGFVKLGINPASTIANKIGRASPAVARFLVKNPTISASILNASEAAAAPLLTPDATIEDVVKMAAMGAAVPAAAAAAKKATRTAASLASSKTDIQKQQAGVYRDSVSLASDIMDKFDPKYVDRMLNERLPDDLRPAIPTRGKADPEMVAWMLEMGTTLTSESTLARAHVIHQIRTDSNPELTAAVDAAHIALTGDSVQSTAARNSVKHVIADLEDLERARALSNDIDLQNMIRHSPDSVEEYLSRYGLDAVYRETYGAEKVERRRLAFNSAMRTAVLSDSPEAEASAIREGSPLQRKAKTMEAVEELQQSVEKLNEQHKQLLGHDNPTKDTISFSLYELKRNSQSLQSNPELPSTVRDLFAKSLEKIATHTLTDVNVPVLRSDFSRALKGVRIAIDRLSRSDERTPEQTDNLHALMGASEALVENLADLDRKLIAANSISEDIAAAYSRGLNLTRVSDLAKNEHHAPEYVKLARNIASEKSTVEQINGIILEAIGRNFRKRIKGQLEVLSESADPAALAANIRKSLNIISKLTAQDVRNLMDGADKAENLDLLKKEIEYISTLFKDPEKGKEYAGHATMAIKALEVIEQDSQKLNRAKRIVQSITNTPESRLDIIRKLPALNALAASIKTHGVLSAMHYGPVLQASKLFVEAHRAIAEQYKGDFPIKDNQIGDVFSLLSGDLATKVRLTQDPAFTIPLVDLVSNTYRAAQIYGAQAARETAIEYRRAFGHAMDMELFLGYYVTPDNAYGANGLFFNLFSQIADVPVMDKQKFDDAVQMWEQKRVRLSPGSVGGKAALLMANTEVMNTIMMSHAALYDGAEIEQLATALRFGNRQKSEQLFKREHKIIDKNIMSGKWRREGFSEAVNLIKGMDGHSKIGFMYSNSKSKDMMKLEIPGVVLREVLSLVKTWEPAGGGKPYTHNRFTREMVAGAQRFVEMTPEEKQVYLADVEVWVRRTKESMGYKDYSAEDQAKIDELLEPIHTMYRKEWSVPKILHHLQKFKKDGVDFASPVFSESLWKDAWEYLEFENKVYRDLHNARETIYAEERYRYSHVGMQLHANKWFDRHISDRRNTTLLINEDIGDRLHVFEDQSSKFKTTEAGQLAKTDGLSYTDPGNLVANPIAVLLDDIHVGIVGARSSHVREVLRQRAVLADDEGWPMIAHWLRLYYQHDLKLKGGSTDIPFETQKSVSQVIGGATSMAEEVARKIRGAGHGGGTLGLKQMVRYGAPPALRVGLGVLKPLFSLARPGSMMWAQPLQAAATYLANVGPIPGNLVDSIPVVRHFVREIQFVAETVIKLGIPAEKFFLSVPSNRRVAMLEVLNGFRDASNRSFMDRLKLISTGSDKITPGGKLGLLVNRLEGGVTDTAMKFKENGETNMTSVSIRLGNSVHEKMTEDFKNGMSAYEVYNKYREVFRIKSDPEVYSHIVRVGDDALADLPPTTTPPSLIPFLTFFVTAGVGRFGPMATPVAINTIRAFASRDTRFYAARFNNSYILASLAIDALQGTKFVNRLGSAWSEKLAHVPSANRMALSALMAYVSAMMVSGILSDGISLNVLGDTVNDDSAPEWKRRAAKLARDGFKVPSIAANATPMQLPWRIEGGQPARTPLIEDLTGMPYLAGAVISPGWAVGVNNLVKLPEVVDDVGDSYLRNTRIMQWEQAAGFDTGLISQTTKFGKALHAYRKSEADPSADREKLRAELETAYKAEQKKIGLRLANYLFHNVVPIDLIHNTAPYYIIRGLNIANAEYIISAAEATAVAEGAAGTYKDFLQSYNISPTDFSTALYVIARDLEPVFGKKFADAIRGFYDADAALMVAEEMGIYKPDKYEKELKEKMDKPEYREQIFKTPPQEYRAPDTAPQVMDRANQLQELIKKRMKMRD